MNWEKLIQLYQDYNPQRENHVFFSTVHKLDDLGPIMSGMSNTIGGIISIGMDFKNVHLRGSNVTKGLIEDTLGTFFSSDINLNYYEVNRNSKYISVLEIIKAIDKPVYYKDICYIFKHDNLFTASAEEEELMRHEQRHVPRESEPEYTNEIKLTEDTEKNNTLTDSIPFNSDMKSSDKDSKYLEIHHHEETETKLSEFENKETMIHADNSVTVFEKETLKESKPAFNMSDSGFPQISHPHATLETLEDFIIHLNKRQRKALKYLKKNNSIKNKIYRKIGDVSHKTAHVELTEMLQYGLIRSQGNGRSTHYVLNR